MAFPKVAKIKVLSRARPEDSFVTLREFDSAFAAANWAAEQEIQAQRHVDVALVNGTLDTAVEKPSVMESGSERPYRWNENMAAAAKRAGLLLQD